MVRTVREFSVFYDIQERYVVPKEQAETIAGQAATIVGKHAGNITLRAPQGLRLPIDMRAVDPEKVRFGPNPHTILFTRRSAADGRRTNGAAATIGETRDSGVATMTRSVVSVDQLDIANRGAVGNTSRLFALGFGLAATCGNLCLMNNPDIALAAGATFCEPCAEDLEIAGYRALATQLPS